MRRSSEATRTVPDLGRITLAVLLGATAGVFVSGYWLIDRFPAGSRQLVLVTIAVAAGSALGYYALAGRIQRGFSGLGFLQQGVLTILAALLGSALLFAGTSEWRLAGRYVGFLLPRHHLQLTAVGAPKGTSLVWLSTSLGDVSYDSLSSHGWIRQGDVMVLQDPAANRLEWSSVTGERLQLVLETSQPGGSVRLGWEVGEQLIPLNSRKTTHQQAFAIPFYASPKFVAALGLLNFLVLSLGLILIGKAPFRGWLGEFGQTIGEPGERLARRDVLLIGVAVGAALLLRVFNLNGVFPAVDEYYHLIAADQILNGAPLHSVYPRGLWIVTLPVALALRTLGHEVWAARAVGVVFNVLAIIPLYLLTRKVSRPVGTAACLLYASSPWIITFGRVAREYAYYPFYFYWIVYAMLLLLEAIPKGFVVAEQWRVLLKPRIILLAALLAFPPIFGLWIDWLSTFRTILIAYVVLGAFVLTRFDWNRRSNWPWLAAAAGLLVLGAQSWYSEQASKLLLVPRLNPVPLQYFFPNPEQQWYFERLAIVMVAALVVAIVGAYAVRRSSIVPLFFAALFLCYLAVFALLSKSFFHTRHLMSTQFWYVILCAMGLCWLWEVLRRAIPWKGRGLQAALAAGLVLSVMNPRQIALPSSSTDPDMPISEDYMHDMSRVQTYLRARVQEHDVLIATVYGLYATWQKEPKFSQQYRITSQTTREEIKSIVDQHPSGWIVVDSIRLDLSPLSIGDFTDMPQMEYIGLFGDEHVWRWERTAALLRGVEPKSQSWTYP